MQDEFDKKEQEDLDTNQDTSQEELEETIKMLEELMKSTDADFDEIEKLVNSSNGNVKIKVVKPFNKKQKVINVITNFIFEFIISFLLIFTLNSFLNLIQAQFLTLLLFVTIYIFIDFSFNLFFKTKFPIINMLSFGVIHLIITVFSLIVSAIITTQITYIRFAEIGLCLFIVLIYVLIKEFTIKYLKSLKTYFKKRKVK